MNILFLNGPNLNLLGTRQTDIYGGETFEHYLQNLSGKYPEVEFGYFQSNIEGELINQLQTAEGEGYGAIIFNPAGYSHTSVAIADAITAIDVPVVEVHISNIHAREEFRHNTLTGAKATGVITGFGIDGYELAVKSCLT